MIKTLYRKLILDCSIFFFITIICTSIIIWVFQAVNFFDIIIEDGKNYTVYLKYTLLSLPKIISGIFPFALFFSLTYVFANYELKNELLIFWSYGVSKITIVNFFLIFSLILMIIQIILTAFIVPKFQNNSRQLIKESSTSYFENFLKPKKFIDTISGLTFFINEIDNNGTLKNIYIKSDTGKNKFQTTHAKKGVFENKDNKRVLVLYDGQTLSGSGENIEVINFSAYDYSVGDVMTGTNVTIEKLQENYTHDLLKCLIILQKNKDSKSINMRYDFYNCTLQNYSNVFKELYKRLILPLYIPLLILVALILITKSKENINFTKFRTYVFLIGLIIIIFSQATQKLINDDYQVNLALSFIPIVIILITYLGFIYNLKTKLIKI